MVKATQNKTMQLERTKVYYCNIYFTGFLTLLKKISRDHKPK